jgi:hypothetical protein
MSEKPYYISPLSGEPVEDLCRLCSQINFLWLLQNNFQDARYRHFKSAHSDEDEPRPIRIPWISETQEFHFPDLSLGFLFEILEKRNHCNFCRLVIHSIAAACETDPERLLEYDFGSCPWQYVFCMLGNSQKAFTNNEVYDLAIELTDIKRGFQRFKQVFLQRIADGHHSPFEGRRVSDQTILETTRRWVSQFSPVQITARVVPGFRVIDVVDHCVRPVSGPLGCRYLALSYVWGGPQNFQNTKATDQTLRQLGSLSTDHQLPQTIRDAIDLVSGIGERYLWVDSLCIVQDDGEAKMAQINAMDLIYSCSVVTIVAAHGSSCHAGLPGIRTHPNRWKQYVSNVRGLELANTQIYLPGAGPRSWHGRGWTFQEHAISRRCIHFALDGITFESEDGFTNEDQYFPTHDPNKPAPRLLGVPIANSVSRGFNMSNIQLYAMAVLFYSGRTLTYQEDGLNAFQGILKLMHARFRRDFLYGLPSSELELSLLWFPGARLDRRLHDSTRVPLFPTWSWAGWKGAVTFPVYESNHFSRVAWINAVDYKTEFAADDWRGIDSDNPTGWSLVPGRHISLAPYYVDNNTLDLHFAHPISESVPERMKEHQFLREGSHALAFFALSARIVSQPGKLSLERDIHAIPGPGIKSHTLYDRFNSFCGVVYIHSPNLSFDTKTLECIVIARTSHGKGNEDSRSPPLDDSDVMSIRSSYAERHELRKKSRERGASSYFDVYDFQLKWQSYDVLVIERRGGIMAERVGVGVCLIEAFWDAEPERKKILLS